MSTLIWVSRQDQHWCGASCEHRKQLDCELFQERLICIVDLSDMEGGRFLRGVRCIAWTRELVDQSDQNELCYDVKAGAQCVR